MSRALGLDRMCELAAAVDVELADGLRQRAARPGDHRERGAQVVRNRGEERIAQALGFCLDARGLRGLRRAVRAPARARSGRRKSRAGGAARAAGRGAGWPAARRARPDVALRAQSGRYSAGAAGKVSEPSPARWPWSATHCAIDRSAPRSEEVERQLRPGSRSRPFASGSRIDRPAVEDFRDVRHGDARHVRQRRASPQARGSSRTAAPCVARALRRRASAAERLPSGSRLPCVTISITANVTRYWTSLTENVKRGGTKQKSNARTFATAATIAGPRPKRSPAIVDAEHIHHHDVGELEIRVHREGDAPCRSARAGQRPAHSDPSGPAAASPAYDSAPGRCSRTRLLAAPTA